MLTRGKKIFVAPGEHGFSFFQVKTFTGSVSVLLSSTSLKIKNFRCPGEHGFSFFQVKIFTGSVSVLLTSTSLKI